MKKILLEAYKDRKQILYLGFLVYVSFLVQDYIPHDLSIIYSTWGAIVVGVVGAGVSLYGASKNREAAEGQYEMSLEAQKEQQAKLDLQKKEYKEMEFENPYADLTNRFANMQNQFAENVYEDLTVNQQQAQFEAQQGSQQRANIMQSMRGAAGTSGIAGLAQVLANQGTLQTQQISASIGQQEARNQALAARGQEQVQRGAAAVDLQRRQGAASIDITQAQGEQWVQQAEMDRQATLLGMEMGAQTGANQAVQQSQANQMQAQIAQQQIYADLFKTIGSTAGEWGGETGNIFTSAN